MLQVQPPGHEHPDEFCEESQIKKKMHFANVASSVSITNDKYFGNASLASIP
jgi:hypothetical protein